MKTIALFATLVLLAAGLGALPTASASFDCDGDPMHWNRDYPTYEVCLTAAEAAHEAEAFADVWVKCLTRTGPCPP